MLNKIIFGLQQFQFFFFKGFREVCNFSSHSSQWLFDEQGLCDHILVNVEGWRCYSLFLTPTDAGKDLR